MNRTVVDYSAGTSGGATSSGAWLSPRARWLLLGPLAAVAGLVAGFHVLLLWERVRSLSLLEPAVASRWLATLALLYGAGRLIRAGVPLHRGRTALAFWLLVLLLHLSFLGPLAAPAPAGLGGGGLLLLLPPAGALLVLTGLAGLALGRPASVAAATRRRACGRPALDASQFARWAACIPLLARRPPPLAAPSR